MTYLKLTCRSEILSAVDEKLTSSCQAFGVTILTRSSQSYWKDERCTEVELELSSSISNEQWHQFFCTVFGADNNIVEEDGKAITHTGSPILNGTDVFAHLFVAGDH